MQSTSEKEKENMTIYLTLQEEEDSGLNEVGVGALSASSLGSTFLLWFPLAKESLEITVIIFRHN